MGDSLQVLCTWNSIQFNHKIKTVYWCFCWYAHAQRTLKLNVFFISPEQKKKIMRIKKKNFFDRLPLMVLIYI